MKQISTSEKMTVAIVLRDLPYPANSGYKKRNYYLIRTLAKAGYNIVLFTGTLTESTEEGLNHIKNLCSKVIIVPTKNSFLNKLVSIVSCLFTFKSINLYLHKHKQLKNETLKLSSKINFDVLICDSLYQTYNIPANISSNTILYEHNIESNIAKQYSEKSNSIIHKFIAHREFTLLKKRENQMWSKFDCCIACSEHDKSAMINRVPESNVLVVNNGVNTSFFSANKNKHGTNTIVYCGQLEWYPNADAVCYFINEIYPYIKQQVPDTRFIAAGNKPTSSIRRLAEKDPSIMVTGFVPDIRPYIEKAAVFIVPLRMGSGTRLKILEAFAMGKAVVSTSIGCEGLAVKNNVHLHICDAPKLFAEKTSKLLKDKEERIRLGTAGKALVQKEYDWDLVFDQLTDYLKK